MRLPQSGKTLVLLIISQNIFYIKNNLFDHKTVPFFSPVKILIPGSSGNVGELSTPILGDLSDLTRIAFERGFAKARRCLWQKNPVLRR